MTTIYVVDLYKGHDQQPIACEVLSKPGAKYLRIDAGPFSLNGRNVAFFDPINLGREVWPRNRGPQWGGAVLYAFASKQEFFGRVEVRARTGLLIERVRLIQTGEVRVTIDQLRQACAHLGISYTAQG